MDKTMIKNPVVVREIDDPELIYFEHIDEVLHDRYDILWDDEYEGWDADGHRFELKKLHPKKRWWHLGFVVDATYLSLVAKAERPSPEIGEMLADYLDLDRTDTAVVENDIAALIRIGVERQSDTRVDYLPPTYTAKQRVGQVVAGVLTFAGFALAFHYQSVAAAVGILVGLLIVLIVIEKHLE